jgi:hypothetical protein
MVTGAAASVGACVGASVGACVGALVACGAAWVAGADVAGAGAHAAKTVVAAINKLINIHAKRLFFILLSPFLIIGRQLNFKEFAYEPDTSTFFAE